MTSAVSSVRPEIRALRAYHLDLSSCRHKLDQNEIAWPLPGRIRRTAVQSLERLDWARYPDFHSDRLRRSLARLHDWPADGVLVGNGSNELLAMTIQALAGPGRVVLGCDPTFTLYRTFAVAAGATAKFAIADDQLRLPRADFEDLAAAHPQATIVLCSPNNPTGEALPVAWLEQLLQRFEGPLLLDNAYGELCRIDYRSLLDVSPRVILFKTFSKAWSLGGIRLGYLLAAPELVSELIKIKLPYNVGLPAQEIGQAVLDSPRTLRRRVAVIIGRRAQWRRMFERHGFEVFASEANYLLIRRKDADRIRRELELRSIRVRDVSSYPRLENCLRVSVGGGISLRAVDTALSDIGLRGEIEDD